MMYSKVLSYELLINVCSLLAPSTWGHSGGPSDEPVEGGTGGWGKSLDATSNWEESEETGGGWGTSRSHTNKSGKILSRDTRSHF